MASTPTVTIIGIKLNGSSLSSEFAVVESVDATVVSSVAAVVDFTPSYGSVADFREFYIFFVYFVISTLSSLTSFTGELCSPLVFTVTSQLEIKSTTSIPANT